MLETDYTVPDECAINIENQSLIVYDDRITWEAQMKNSRAMITTYEISVELLRGLTIAVND